MTLRFAHQASLRLQLGDIAFSGGRYSEAVEQYTIAVESGSVLTKHVVPAAFEAFTVVR